MAEVLEGPTTTEVTILLDRLDLARLFKGTTYPSATADELADRLVLTHVDRAAMHDDKLVRICMLLTEGETDE
jgi:hypothetical protein